MPSTAQKFLKNHWSVETTLRPSAIRAIEKAGLAKPRYWYPTRNDPENRDNVALTAWDAQGQSIKITFSAIDAEETLKC